MANLKVRKQSKSDVIFFIWKFNGNFSCYNHNMSRDVEEECRRLKFIPAKWSSQDISITHFASALWPFARVTVVHKGYEYRVHQFVDIPSCIFSFFFFFVSRLMLVLT